MGLIGRLCFGPQTSSQPERQYQTVVYLFYGANAMAMQKALLFPAKVGRVDTRAMYAGLEN